VQKREAECCFESIFELRENTKEEKKIYRDLNMQYQECQLGSLQLGHQNLMVLNKILKYNFLIF
jgi:hypothetical protein